jgi:endonuclease/exonuclease/phosphatase family metal-dependent hydrolase
VRPPWRIVERRLHVFELSTKALRRGALFGVVGRAGARVEVVSVHLGLVDPERVRHARELSDLLAASRQWVIVGGDLNEGPDAPAASWMAERYWDAFATAGTGEGSTFPSGAPRARIDYLFVSDGVRVERAWVGGNPRASDHLPVLADVVIGD